MLKHLGPIVATSIVVLFLLISALPLLHWFERDGREAALDEHRALWRGLGIDDYRVSVAIDCDCGVLAAGPLDVTVLGGTVGSVADADGRQVPLPAADWPATVGRLFDRVAEAIDEGVDDLTVTYDENYGFPREVRIDPDEDLDGDETTLIASGFDPRVTR